MFKRVTTLFLLLAHQIAASAAPTPQPAGIPAAQSSKKETSPVDAVPASKKPTASKDEMDTLVREFKQERKRLDINQKTLFNSLSEKKHQLLIIKRNFPEYEKLINDRLADMVLAKESVEIRFYTIQSSFGLTSHTPYGYSVFYGRLMEISDSFHELVESGRELEATIKNFTEENVDLTLNVWFASVTKIDEVNSRLASVSELKSTLMRALFEKGHWKPPAFLKPSIPQS